MTVTLDDAKLHLGILDSNQDTLIESPHNTSKVNRIGMGGRVNECNSSEPNLENK